MKNGMSKMILATILTGAGIAGVGLAMQSQAQIKSANNKAAAQPAAASVEKAAAAGQIDQAKLVGEAKGLIKQFAGRLKGELVAAMKADGPAAAVGVCQSAAPTVTEEVNGNAQGWKIGRTALKLRNRDNKPDAFELKVLQQFEKQRAAGADPKQIAHKEIVNVDGKPVFRFMKAIPTGQVCLKCHGAAIKDDVRVQLKDLYPDDQATGFKAGDIRGAFTLSRPLD